MISIPLVYRCIVPALGFHAKSKPSISVQAVNSLWICLFPFVTGSEMPLNRFRGGPKLGLFALTLQELGARCLDMLEFWPRHMQSSFFPFHSKLGHLEGGSFASRMNIACIFTSICQSGFIRLERRVKIRKPSDSMAKLWYSKHE